MRRRTPTLLALLISLPLVLAGCTGATDDTAASESAGGAAAPAAAGGGDTAGSSGSGALPAVGALTVDLPAGQARPGGRSLIRTADVRLRVDDVRGAADRAAALARAAGGLVAAEDRSGEEDLARADLTLQVPPARLDATLEQVARLGDEQERRVGSEDVTEQVVDLESRLATQRASVGRVRALLDRATGLGDVVKVEGELARREADLEALQARVRAVTAQVELATLVVHLEGPDAPTATQAAGFRDGLDGGWAALRGSTQVLATVVGAVLPFVPLIVLGALVARWLRGRRRTHPRTA